MALVEIGEQPGAARLPARQSTGQRVGGRAVDAQDRWVDAPGRSDLPRLIRESFDELKAVTAGN